MRSWSPAQSCGHRGRRSTAAAVVADGAARHVADAWPVPGRVHLAWGNNGEAIGKLKALHEKTPGEKSLLISYGIHRRRWFAWCRSAIAKGRYGRPIGLGLAIGGPSL